MSTDSAGPHADRREGEPAWRNPVANQAFNGADPHTKVVSDPRHMADMGWQRPSLRPEFQHRVDTGGSDVECRDGRADV
jgi:hypothetical protein